MQNNLTYHKEESQSIKYQANNIEKNIENVGPPTKALIALHELVQWIPLFGIMKLVHACLKKKLRKLAENSENVCRKEDGSK